MRYSPIGGKDIIAEREIAAIEKSGAGANMAEKNWIIDKMEPNDWKHVCAIYLEGISTGHATFDPQTPDWESWDADHLPQCRFVAQIGEEIAGWASLSPVSERCVYAGVAEVSVYVAPEHQEQGIGSALLAALIAESEKVDIWTLQAGIFPENTASLALHKRHGFREVGYREKLGKMEFGQLEGTWRDVVLLERRSRIVGTD